MCARNVYVCLLVFLLRRKYYYENDLWYLVSLGNIIFHFYNGFTSNHYFLFWYTYTYNVMLLHFLVIWNRFVSHNHNNFFLVYLFLRIVKNFRYILIVQIFETLLSAGTLFNTLSCECEKIKITHYSVW